MEVGNASASEEAHISGDSTVGSLQAPKTSVIAGIAHASRRTGVQARPGLHK